jgi:hypothetical protein
MPSLGFTGGSITSGYGWNLHDPADADNHWVTQVHNFPEFVGHKLINRSVDGGSNEQVFANSVDLLTSCPDLDTLFCCWVSYPRYNFDLGFELYATGDGLSNPTINDHHLNTGTIPVGYLNNIKSRFATLQHPHRDIVKIVKYQSILNQLNKLTKVKIYYINDSCHWDQDYFVRLDGPNVLPNNYTSYTKNKILNITNRDDREIFSLYKKMHNDYDQAGGISYDKWINLYNSFVNLQIDCNHDNVHPGKQSNLVYSNLIKQYLKKT